jgi:hypothetical protein
MEKIFCFIAFPLLVKAAELTADLLPCKKPHIWRRESHGSAQVAPSHQIMMSGGMLGTSIYKIIQQGTPIFSNTKQGSFILYLG